ncbi:MAG: DNA polymerase III subunit delta' [Clostridia bacterium]|nr:DNA polymerase III subunit delta' [Clostridia bacterium]
MSSSDPGNMGLTIRECAAGSDSLLALCHDFFSGRMAHATLLSGEKGIGKRTMARLLAQGLVCRGQGEKPCGQCRDCKRFLSRTHPDALFPAPKPRENSIKIEALREMINALSRHSLEGGKRVILIEEAERMTPQAQNCLLKTLEEADEGTYFILTTHAESALLPTIRSRCRIVRMQPWTSARIEKTLLAQNIPADRARALSRYCEGSLGRALSMQEDEHYWQSRDLIRRSFLSIRRSADIPAAAALLKDQKDNCDQLLDILEQQIRGLIHQKITGDEAADDVPDTFLQASPGSLRKILEAILQARRHKNANVGWAALAEGLMQTISEESSTWQA